MLRPVYIYWLIAVASSTPFYCGYSVHPEKRLRQHLAKAAAFPNRDLSLRLEQYRSQGIRAQIMHTVPEGADYREREKAWTALLFRINPNAANMTVGGNGGSVPKPKKISTPNYSPRFLVSDYAQLHRFIAEMRL